MVAVLDCTVTYTSVLRSVMRYTTCTGMYYCSTVAQFVKTRHIAAHSLSCNIESSAAGMHCSIVRTQKYQTAFVSAAQYYY